MPTAVAGLVAVVAIVAAAAAGVHIDGEAHRWRDESGRELLFHGVNVIYKHPPYLPDADAFDARTSFVEEDMALLAGLGLNAIRLGTMFPGAMPAKNAVNATYVAQVRKIVDACAAHGIFVLADAHQDVLSRVYCGEGVPEWATLPRPDLRPDEAFPEPFDRPFVLPPGSRIPSDADCAKRAWSDYQVTFAGASAYQSLYDNRDGIRDSFGAFWAAVASSLASAPNLIGYELLNEPFAGDIFEHPSLLDPPVADRTNLAPFYEAVAAAIRAVDDTSVILFEPVTWSDLGTGFTGVPGGPAYRNRSALSYHFYTPPQVGRPGPYFADRLRDIARLGCGGLLTEFSIGSQAGPSSYATMTETMAAADAALQGWLGWEYKPFVPITGWDYGLFNANGTLNALKAKTLARSYPMATQGTLHGLAFDPDTAVLAFDFVLDTAALPTLVYASSTYYYPNGYTVTTDPPAALLAVPLANSRLELHPATSTAPGTHIAVTIAPKP